MADAQKIPDLAGAGTFSLILNFTGKAALAPQTVDGAAVVRQLNAESSSLAAAIAAETRSTLQSQLPGAEVSVTLDFAMGIHWAGVLLITDTRPRVADNDAFSKYACRSAELVVNKAIRKAIEQQALDHNATVTSVVTRVRRARNQILSQRTSFLWWCAGAIPELLRQYPSEKAKYEGIGGAVLTTGALAFLSGFYAIYTTLSSGRYGLVASAGFGLLWAVAIFNLDRYIVSSLRKPTDASAPWRRRFLQGWLPAVPRLGLAILIGITLSKPLELRLFHSAIAGQAEINRDAAVTAKRTSLTESSRLAAINAELDALQAQIGESENRAKFLEDEFRKETDGTGGSLRYGYSEVARVKEAAAQQARRDLASLRASVQGQLDSLQTERNTTVAGINQQVDAFRQGLADDFLTRMTALSNLAASSRAMWWISTFVMLLIVAIEITPVMVKLLSPVGPYDVKLDAMNAAETHEALLKRDVAIRVATHHYEQAEKAEFQADDALLDVRTTLVRDELDYKASQWRQAKAAGASTTMDQFINDVRTEILTQRGG